jgi:hypothetical protein
VTSFRDDPIFGFDLRRHAKQIVSIGVLIPETAQVVAKPSCRSVSARPGDIVLRPSKERQRPVPRDLLAPGWLRPYPCEPPPVPEQVLGEQATQFRSLGLRRRHRERVSKCPDTWCRST